MGWFSKKDKEQEEVPASSGHVSSSPVPGPSSLPPPGFKEASDHDKLVTEKLGDFFRKEEGIEEARPHPSLGVIRLDYEYPPAPGDIDHPASFGYRVHYRMVKGLTFEMCQKGHMTDEVHDEFVEAIKDLEKLHVSAITGDCGFMFWFQELVREYTTKPVLLSSLVQLPSITCSLGRKDQVAIFTANGESLHPMLDEIAEASGVKVSDNRYIIVGCEKVPGFEAVALGAKVNTQKVQPGIVELAKKTIAEHPRIRALLLECTELPPYADALRYATALPVYDAITCSDSFVDGFMDNPRFGMDGWMRTHHGKEHKYRLGVDLTPDDEIRCASCGANLVQKVEAD